MVSIQIKNGVFFPIGVQKFVFILEIKKKYPQTAGWYDFERGHWLVLTIGFNCLQ